MTEFEQAVLDRLDRIAILLGATAPAGAGGWTCGLCHRWVPYAELHACASLRGEQ